MGGDRRILNILTFHHRLPCNHFTFHTHEAPGSTYTYLEQDIFPTHERFLHSTRSVAMAPVLVLSKSPHGVVLPVGRVYALGPYDDTSVSTFGTQSELAHKF